MSDPELVAFCEREHARLVGLLRLYCGEEALAQELAQEALLRAVSHWPRIRRLDSPGGWTYRVAINLANSRFRRRSAARRARERLDGEHDRAAPVDDHEIRLVVRRALAGLPARQREAVVLCHYLGYPPGEVAGLMGCSAQAVRNLTHRARVQLRAILAPEVDDATRS